MSNDTTTQTEAMLIRTLKEIEATEKETRVITEHTQQLRDHLARGFYEHTLTCPRCKAITDPTKPKTGN
jgi:hypothetical protein